MQKLPLFRAFYQEILAAAVSDFYIPQQVGLKHCGHIFNERQWKTMQNGAQTVQNNVKQDMETHKIQSDIGALDIHLEGVPKMLGTVRSRPG